VVFDEWCNMLDRAAKKLGEGIEKCKEEIGPSLILVRLEVQADFWEAPN
jgi:hypothetical protein